MLKELCPPDCEYTCWLCRREPDGHTLYVLNLDKKRDCGGRCPVIKGFYQNGITCSCGVSHCWHRQLIERDFSSFSGLTCQNFLSVFLTLADYLYEQNIEILDQPNLIEAISQQDIVKSVSAKFRSPWEQINIVTCLYFVYDSAVIRLVPTVGG